MFDRAFDFVVDSTRRTAAGPLDRCSQTETVVWSGGANLAAAKVALSGVAWCLALGWAIWPSLALALALVVMGLTLLLLVMSKQNDD